MEVTVHNTFKTISEDQWESLWKSMPTSNIYQTWSWFNAWEKHFVQPGSLRVLLFSENGQLVGAAPLFIFRESRLGIFKRKVLTFASSYSLPYPLDQGPLVDPDRVDQIISKMAIEISKLKGFNIISFELFEHGGLTWKLLQALSRHINCRVSCKILYVSHIVILPETYEAFIKTLGKSTRKNIRKAHNRFFEEKSNKVEIIKSSEEVAELVETLSKQKNIRFSKKEEYSTFKDSRFVSFLNDVCVSFLRDGRLLGMIARVNGKIAATQLVLLDQNGYSFAYNSSFDSIYRDMRIHYVLESMRFKYAIKMGYRWMDLSAGHDHHKNHWSKGNTRNLYEGILVIRPLENTAFYLLDELKTLFKRFSCLNCLSVWKRL